MTYWGYHLIFTLPLMLILLYRNRQRISKGIIGAWAVVCLIVMIFTAPWDNYAVFLGIWFFGEGVSLDYPFSGLAEHTPLLGHIPFEEYAYFWIEATLRVVLGLLSASPRAAGRTNG